MKAITHHELKVNLDEIQEITELCINQNINQHASCYIKGVLSEESKEKLVTDNLENREIEVYAELKGKEILFKGLIQHSCIHEMGNYYEVEIQSLSYSIQTDIKRKSKSYQDCSEKYEDIIRKIVRAYSSGDIKDFASNYTPIGQLIVQYEETDWEFLLRLASHFNMGIVPNVTLKGPKIIFGTTNKRKIEDLKEML